MRESGNLTTDLLFQSFAKNTRKNGKECGISSGNFAGAPKICLDAEHFISALNDHLFSSDFLKQKST